MLPLCESLRATVLKLVELEMGYLDSLKTMRTFDRFVDSKLPELKTLQEHAELLALPFEVKAKAMKLETPIVELLELLGKIDSKVNETVNLWTANRREYDHLGLYSLGPLGPAMFGNRQSAVTKMANRVKALVRYLAVELAEQSAGRSSPTISIENELDGKATGEKSEQTASRVNREAEGDDATTVSILQLASTQVEAADATVWQPASGASEQAKQTTKELFREPHINCLRALKALEAISPKRVTRLQIAQHLEKLSNEGLVRDEIALLSKHGFVDTIKNRPSKMNPGNVCITDKGLQLLKERTSKPHRKGSQKGH